MMEPGTDGPTTRLLGNNRPVLLLATVGFAVTVGILMLQMHLRTGLYEPRVVPIFPRLFLFEDYPASFLMLVAILLTLFLTPARRLGATLAEAIGRRPLLTACVAFPVLCLGSLFVYEAHPLAMDESAPYMQSRIFASGHLLGQYPPELLDWLVHDSVREFFIHVSRESGQLASTYWPGFALLLTPFTALGIPWVCNPLLGALALLVVHRLVIDLTRSVEAAGTAVLFVLASAAFMINSISFYSMTAHLLCNALFAMLLLRPGANRALLAGITGGLALNLHNPVPHALFALPWVLWIFWGRRWKELLALMVGYIPAVVAGLGWRFLIDDLVGDRGQFADPSLGGAVVAATSLLGDILAVPGPLQLLERVMALGKIWLWATPLLMLLAVAGFWRHRHERVVWLLAASGLLTFVGYLFVPVSQGHGWGFRYFHSAWFVLPVLAALLAVPARSSGAVTYSTSSAGNCVSLGRAGALAGLFILVPFFAWQTRAFIVDHLRQVPEARTGESRLILISPQGYYSLDLVQNDPFLREPVIRMILQGGGRDEEMIAQHFPDLVLLSRDPHGQVWGVAPGVQPVDK